MITDAVTRRAKALRAQGEPFVTATVVRAQRPTSVRAGSVAIVLADGTIEGFIGGVCAEQSVRVYALKAMASGEPVLLRILPDVDETEAGIDGHEVPSEEGSVTVKNPCLSAARSRRSSSRCSRPLASSSSARRRSPGRSCSSAPSSASTS